MHLVDKVNNSSSLQELDQVFNDSSQYHTSLTFWGSRIVTREGFEGSITLNSLSKRIWHLHVPELQSEESPAFRSLLGKACQFYQETDELRDHANWFTWLFTCIREYSFIPYTPRFYMETS